MTEQDTLLIKEFERLAEMVKAQLQLGYDAQSVKFIEGFIERNKTDFTSEEHQGLITSIGSFLGQCIIVTYGGTWQVDPATQAMCIDFDGKNKAFPFAKTSKQFENGLEDSVYSLFRVIPIVFKLDLPSSPANSYPENADKGISKPWWRFW